MTWNHYFYIYDPLQQKCEHLLTLNKCHMMNKW